LEKYGLLIASAISLIFLGKLMLKLCITGRTSAVITGKILQFLAFKEVVICSRLPPARTTERPVRP